MGRQSLPFFRKVEEGNDSDSQSFDSDCQDDESTQDVEGQQRTLHSSFGDGSSFPRLLGTESQSQGQSPKALFEKRDLAEAMEQVDDEVVSNVLQRLNSIRQLAGDAQVLRRKESREQNTRRMHIAQMHSLLLEEAEFNSQAVQQRSVLAMMEGIKLQYTEIFFFSVEEVRKGMITGPTVRLRDALNHPHHYAERLPVDTDLLFRMFAELQTTQLQEIHVKSREYLTFKHTTYQVKSVEEDHSTIKNASGIAVLDRKVFVADCVSHCIWRVPTARLTGKGSPEVELFAGRAKEPGFKDGPLNDARFHCPMGLAISEAAKTLFIVDTENHAIRRIFLNGCDLLVETINLTPAPHALDFSFTQPKSICVVHGDQSTFLEMEVCQQKQTQLYELQLKESEVRSTISSLSSSESSDSSGSGEDSSSFFSNCGSSSSSSSSSSSAGDKSSRPPTGQSTVSRRTAGYALSIPVPNVICTKEAANEHAADNSQLTLEQSLSYERMKKYSVLYDTDMSSAQGAASGVRSKRASAATTNAARSNRGSAVTPAERSNRASHSVKMSWSNRASLSAAHLPPTPPLSATFTRPLTPTEASRRLSLGPGESLMQQDRQDPLGASCQKTSRAEIRLAVTCDHCVWYIDPHVGHARVIAGNPVQYGYCDAPLGLQARFSSPKGVINVRSVLFVADYWNNVVRCINLYTTQVDTVVDFCPEGPVSMCLSNSGVLYVLDSENIHYTNMLRIMSTRRGGDAESLSTPSIVEDKLFYQSMFSQPRSRASSVMSDNTRCTNRLEVWDMYQRSSIVGKVGSTESSSTSRTTSAMPGGLQSDFQARLSAHLTEAANEQDTVNREEKKQQKKRRRQLKKEVVDKKEEAGKDAPICYTFKTEMADKNEDVAKDEQAETQISTTDEPTKSEESTTAAPSGESQAAGESEPNHLAEALHEQLQKLQHFKGSESTKLGIALKKMRRSSSLSPVAKSPFPRSPRARSSCPSPCSVMPSPSAGLPTSTDYVEQAKFLLLQMSSGSTDRGRRRSSVCHDDCQPMTLSDLGVAGHRMSRSGSISYSAELPPATRSRSHRGSWAMPSQTLALPVPESLADQMGAMVAPIVMRRTSNMDMEQQYRMLPPSPPAPDTADPASLENAGRGTVMVRGGKTFYRSWSTPWSEHKSMLSKSNLSSRRVSEANTENGIVGRIDGQDEEGRLVAFVDLTLQSSTLDSPFQTSRRSSQSMFDSRRGSSLWVNLSDATRPEGSRRESKFNFSRRGSTSVVSTRRESVVEWQGQPDRRGSNEASSEERQIRLERRGSIGGGVTLERRASQRRNSIGLDLQRRNSIGLDLQRRNSIGLEQRDNVGPGMLTQRRDTLTLIDGNSEKPLSMVMMGHRSSIADRRGSGLFIMPTVLDSEECGEGDAEGEGEIRKVEHHAIVEGDENMTEEESATKSHDQESATKSHEQNRSSEGAGIHTQEAHTSEVASNTNTMSVKQSVAVRTQEETSDADSNTTSEDNDDHSGGNTGPRPGLASDAEQVPVISLSAVPFTRDIDVNSLADDICKKKLEQGNSEEHTSVKQRRTTGGTSCFGIGTGNYKVAESKVSKIWRPVPLPDTLSQVHRGTGRKYPNTPLAITFYEQADECFIFIGLLCVPTLLKIIPPKHHEPDKGGRFNVLPLDSQRFLLADENSHQIWLVNFIGKMKKLIAGCGKRGYVDGPLEVCRMHSPCSLALDPRTHHLYIADRGNHVIRKIDLSSGIMSTIAGSGVRGNRDGSDRARQALDSPFEVSFSEPHFLLISCSDNSVRNLHLKTGFLETLLVGS